ncbi:MAG: S-layer homology domain-containing protein [Oscillospiraceae bacterium]|jgi:hypothetical protein
MKKRAVAAALALVITGGLFGVFAATNAGSGDDPLISLSYLSGTLSPGLLSQAEAKINSGLQSVFDSAVSDLPAQDGFDGYSFAPKYIQARMKNGDIVYGKLGTSLVVLSGSVTVSFASGAVIDITSGAEIPSGSELAPFRRYLVAENTSASFSVAGDTAVLQYEGPYYTNLSSSVDYNSMAEALAAMGLFRGDGTGFGSGFALERGANRIEGLIMFIRMLGEESKALSFTGSHPFTDVPKWASPYVAYAYEKGYTKGVGATVFGTTDALSSQHYLTFIMRALCYEEGTDFTWETAVDSALRHGIITAGEYNMARSGVFPRSRVVYFSYYALSETICGTGKTILGRLYDNGVTDRATAEAAMSRVKSPRL